jgi:hypothetical protein
MKRALLVLALLLLLAAPLVVAFRDMGRLMTMEAMRLAWTVRLAVEGLPQLGLWAALMVLILVTALRSLAGQRRGAPGDEARPPVESHGQVWELSRWIQHASLGEYPRWTLDRRLESLAWEAMAARRGSTATEIRRRFRAGELPLDADIAAFLESARRRHFQRRAGLWAQLRRMLRRDDKATPSLPSVERIVAFLEEQLAPARTEHISQKQEIEHDHDIR